MDINLADYQVEYIHEVRREGGRERGKKVRRRVLNLLHVAIKSYGTKKIYARRIAVPA